MKIKILSVILLLAMTVSLFSCYSSRKSGCPGNPEATSRFKG